MKWPFISRKSSDAAIADAAKAIREAEQKAARANSIAEQLRNDLAHQRAEWDRKWRPVFDCMTGLSASREVSDGSFSIIVRLGREMMEYAASSNDMMTWKYVAEELSRHFCYQLQTMNFVGLHKLARETDDSIRRKSRTYDNPFQRS